LYNTSTSAFATVNDYLSYLLLKTASGTTLKIQKYPLRISYLDNTSTAKFTERTGIYYQYGKWGVAFDVSGTEAFYGTGSRAIDLNLRGKSFSTYNQANIWFHFWCANTTISMCLLLFRVIYMVCFLIISSAGNFNIANSDSTILQYACDTLPLSYFIFGGSTIYTASIMNKYTSLTGKQPLPPRWSLGYTQSKIWIPKTRRKLEVL
jgi:alpha-glucosidase (family GH31 glycosyl hydrolase)